MYFRVELFPKSCAISVTSVQFTSALPDKFLVELVENRLPGFIKVRGLHIKFHRSAIVLIVGPMLGLPLRNLNAQGKLKVKDISINATTVATQVMKHQIVHASLTLIEIKLDSMTS